MGPQPQTQLHAIVGASGSLYAIRASLHRTLVPEALSRDFATALIAHELGYRAVSVDDAVCYVPRGTSLHREYRRKVRTMARGLETLWYKRHLLNPLRHGVFAWMLWSHKLLRWLVPWAIVAGALLACGGAQSGGTTGVEGPGEAERSGSGTADTVCPARAEALQDALEALTTADGSTGAILAVATADCVPWVSAVGLADLSTGAPATPGHMFSAGSISKLFTATS